MGIAGLMLGLYSMHKIFSHKAVHKVRSFIRARKVTSGIILTVLIVGGYFAVSALKGGDSETRYILGTVARSTIASSVTGSGQVSASSQVDLKTKASGDVIYLGVKSGQEVKAGALIVQLNAREAQKAVRDAEANLENAKLSHQKLLKPADSLSMIQAENALSQATANLAKAYDDGFNSVSNAFLDLPIVMAGLFDITSGTNTGQSGQDNLSAYAGMITNVDSSAVAFRDRTWEAYLKARSAYNHAFLTYRSASRLSDKATTDALINETYDATKTVADAVKTTNDFLSLVKDRLTEHKRTLPTTLAPHLSSLSTYIGDTNSNLLSLLGIKDTITSSKYSISEKTESLSKLKFGAETLDISSSELTIRQRENALLDAKERLADYVVRAPFDGTVAVLSIKKTDSAGSGVTVGTFITKQKIAEISLNEVDVSKVQVEQKATLTFDAIDQLVVEGTVVEMDTVGTVSQGVVTYNVKIGFDSPENQVKPGMSVTAAIVTETKENVLVVPQAAVKSQGREQYVEVVDEKVPPEVSGGRTAQGILLASPLGRQTVETGISNNTLTQIVSGLEEGETIVVRTITASKTPSVSQAQTPSIFGAPTTGRGSSGGNIRFQR